MAGKLVAFIAVSIMIGMAAGYAASVAFAPKATTSTQDPVILDRTGSPEATNIPAEHQHQNTLSPSEKMTGRVILLSKFVENEEERFHFLVVPDLEYRGLLNDANRDSLGGAMMVEILKDDMGILPRLHIGQHLEIRGPWVVDNDNAYNEIDPAIFIKDLGV